MEHTFAEINYLYFVLFITACYIITTVYYHSITILSQYAMLS